MMDPLPVKITLCYDDENEKESPDVRHFFRRGHVDLIPNKNPTQEI
jgi:hypothetical protein